MFSKLQSCFVLLEIEPGTSHVLGKLITTELHPQFMDTLLRSQKVEGVGPLGLRLKGL